MSTVDVYKTDDGQLTLERTKGRKAIMRAMYSGTTLPVLKCSCPMLSIIFSKFGVTHQHAARLDWDDTYRVIRYLLEDMYDKKEYKPSCMMHYKVTVDADYECQTIGMSFEVFYHLWKRKLNEETSNYTWEDMITEPVTICYEMSAEDFFKIICFVSIMDEETAAKMWINATNAGFIMESDYDFGDMDLEALSVIYDDLDFGSVDDMKDVDEEEEE